MEKLSVEPNGSYEENRDSARGVYFAATICQSTTVARETKDL